MKPLNPLLRDERCYGLEYPRDLSTSGHAPFLLGATFGIHALREGAVFYELLCHLKSAHELSVIGNGSRTGERHLGESERWSSEKASDCS
jgi:hypothetical protein